jgi:hypothetical protein
MQTMTTQTLTAESFTEALMEILSGTPGETHREVTALQVLLSNGFNDECRIEPVAVNTLEIRSPAGKFLITIDPISD